MAKSSAASFLPLVLTFILLAVLAVVGFIVYQVVADVADKTSKKMEDKNMSFSKDGFKVGIKHVSTEQIGDSTQNVLVKTWNASSFPNYKSRLGWGQKKAA